MKWIAPVAAIISTALVAFSGEIQMLIVAHPAWAGAILALQALVSAFAPQPHKD